MTWTPNSVGTWSTSLTYRLTRLPSTKSCVEPSGKVNVIGDRCDLPLRSGREGGEEKKDTEGPAILSRRSAFVRSDTGWSSPQWPSHPRQSWSSPVLNLVPASHLTSSPDYPSPPQELNNPLTRGRLPGRQDGLTLTNIPSPFTSTTLPPRDGNAEREHTLPTLSGSVTYGFDE